MIMIRKLKNILKPHDSSSIESTNSHCSYDVASTDSISSYRSTNTDKSKHGSPKINFIKRSMCFFKFGFIMFTYDSHIADYYL